MPPGRDPRADDAAERFARALPHDPARRRARDLHAYGPPRRTGLVWIGIAVVGLVVFVLLILAILDRTRGTAGPSAAVDAADGRTRSTTGN